MNPYALLGGLLIWLASVAGVGYWQHGAGVADQKATDQVEFDAINTKLARQKDQANVMYRAKADEVIALQAANDKFKHDVEVEREQHRAESDALRTRYAGLSLRYSAAQAAGSGGGGVRPDGAQADPASASGAAVVQLPDSVAAGLRQLAFDADQLKADYGACYAYVQGPVK